AERLKSQQMIDFFASRPCPQGPDCGQFKEFGCSRLSLARGAPERGCIWKVMGIVMKKLALLATALAMVSGSAFAADMAVKAVKAPPPAAFDPWDLAFGSAIMNDYIFRGITQSNHNPPWPPISSPPPASPSTSRFTP